VTTLHSLSNEVTATTLIGMDYPFLDTAEGGPACWTADPPWAITSEEARSGSASWSDSPGGDYSDNISTQSLTLAAPLDLSAATDPVWTFWYKAGLVSGDFCYAEVSTDNGSSWTPVATVSNAENTTLWQQERISLSAYLQPSVLLRIRLTTNATDTADGIYIDDISVAEAPAAIPTPVISGLGSHEVTLSWAENLDPQLDHYAIVRSTGTTVDLGDLHVAAVDVDAPRTFTDTGLTMNSDYAYRVYPVTKYGTYSDDSSIAASIHTLSQPAPFSEGFEDSSIAWTFGSNNANPATWALSDEASRTGSFCLTDSPSASYSTSVDSYAETSVDLSATTWPILSFWDMVDLNTGDWVRLEVSAEGKSTLYLYSARESGHSDWRQQRVDLSYFNGHSQVKIRFRIVSDGGASPGDGWFIDDLSVVENPDGATAATLPVLEDFESASLQDRWIAAGWHSEPDPAPVDGTRSARHLDGDLMVDDTRHELILDQPLTLASGSHVQVTFWLKGNFESYTYLRLKYSNNGGASWNELGALNINGPVSYLNYTRLQADLSSLAGQTIWLKFEGSVTSFRGFHMNIDKVTIAEMPEPVALLNADPDLRSVDLEWDQSSLGTDFVRYEVWRSTSANVSVNNGTKVFETADPLITTATDTGLNIGGTYFYKVFVVDQRDTYIPSNEMSTTTVPVELPFSDSMDAMDNWVVGTNNGATLTWDTATSDVHEGTGCIAVMPTGQYLANSDTYIETAVDLTGTTWPILSFWDKVDLNTGDWVRLEISADGRSTFYLYSVRESGHSDWRQQRIDLSYYKGHANVRIRFRLVSDNAATTATGWFLDDLSVVENPDGATAATLPVLEDFESASLQDRWIAAGWHSEPDPAPVDGTRSARHLDGDLMVDDTRHELILDQPLVLAPSSNVQVTFWLKGDFESYTYFRLKYSNNGGASWNELGALNINGTVFYPDYTRLQADLSSLAGQTIWLKFEGNVSSFRGFYMNIDKVTIAEMPESVALLTTDPALRSVDLEWGQSGLGTDFVHYEVWRSTSANVSVNNGTKVFETADPLITSATDTGLNIGGTYFYKVFVVDRRDTYIPSNEMSTTTVPLSLPLADSMDAMDNWVVGTNNGATLTWDTATSDVHEGTGCIAVMPTGQYLANSDTYIETAVDLTGTTWPILSFWDKVDLNTGDWVRLEISADGRSTFYLYSVRESGHSDWRQQRIDLSYYKGHANVRIRFRLVSDNAATTATGWFLDDLSVVENPDGATAATLPVLEDFESASLQDRWIAAGWHSEPDPAPVDGTRSARHLDGDLMVDDTRHELILDQPLVLAPSSNVQVTFWLKGDFESYTYFRLKYSNNGGASWNELGALNINGTVFYPDYTRLQADLSSLAGQTIWLKFEGNVSSFRGFYMNIDKVTIAEMPQEVLTQPIDNISVTSLRLNWIASALPSFAQYRIYRSQSANVDTSSTLVAEITNQATVSHLDTGLDGRTPYYYKIYVVDDRGTHIPSDTVSATTLGLSLPLATDFESSLDGWTVTGNWQLLEGVGREGSKALVDSVGNYLPSTSTNARFAVDLSGMEWPVLRFWDKHDFAGGSYGRIEISTDGSNWGNFIYGVTGTRTQWAERSFDLSPWKNTETVYIRFARYTDGNIADGWIIDDLSIRENSNEPVYPVFDGFESDSGMWLSGRWSRTSDLPESGSYCLHDSMEGRYAEDCQQQLILAHDLDLASAVNPTLTYFVRGNLVSSSYFRVYVSINGGLDWILLNSLNINYNWNSIDTWNLQQISLSPYIGQTIRLKFETQTTNQANADFFIDNIGIGEDAPDAPILLSPGVNESVDIVRPTLSVQNAVDYQSDALTHQFQVFADENLTSLVAEVPAVASGLFTTSWKVDVNLPDNATYWWRARANDGVIDGPWSATYVFFVNEVNQIPDTVVLTGPPDSATLYNSDEWLIWLTTSDPDVGDQILDYHLQIDDDPLFGSPLVSIPGLTTDEISNPGILVGLRISEISGAESLTAGRWYWRVRARDTRFAYSAWPLLPLSFRIASDYEHWLLANFSVAEQDDVTLTGEDSDSDRDSVPLMIEYASAMDTSLASQEGAPKQVMVNIDGATHLAIEFDRRIGTDLVFTLEASGDMHGWSRTSAAVEVLHAIDTLRERCRLTDPIPIGEKRFVRLSVNLPD
jgi:hypothetical protein